MPEIGIIGTGRIGTMLAKGLVNTGTVLPKEIVVQNRNKEKAEQLSRQIPGINIALYPGEVINNTNIIFLCIKPQDFNVFMQNIEPRIPREKLFVSTLLAPSLELMDQWIKGPVARVYPGIVQETGRGVSLIAFGKEVSEVQRNKLLKIFTFLGKTYEIPEKYFRTCGDITSCGPAFMAHMIGGLSRTAVRQGIEHETARDMALETIVATVLYLSKNSLSFEELVDLVATPGGCTREGINVLEKNLDYIIEEVFNATEKREKEIMNVIKKQKS